MPPSLTRPAFSAWSGALCLRPRTTIPSTSIIARHIHRPSETQRLEGTLPPNPNSIRIPPDSPKYITVPEPPQNKEVRLPRVRGHLPIPRDVFRRRSGGGGTLKGTDPATYVQQIRPKPQRRKPKSPEEAAHRKTAQIRRENLEQGLRGLWKRRESTRRSTTKQRRARNRANRRAAEAAERRDEVLTRGSVTAATRNTAVQLDPQRFEKAAASLARTQARAAAKSEVRRDALAHLYMAAGNFIVDEKELEERVEKLFQPDHHLNMSTFASYGAKNQWTSQGKPSTLQELVAMQNGAYSNLIEFAKDPMDRTTDRQKKVSEELTGGKLDDA